MAVFLQSYPVSSVAWRRGKHVSVIWVRCAPSPGRAEVGATGEQGQDTGSGALVNQECQELQRRGVHPMEIFHDEEHRLLGGNVHQDGQEGPQGLLLLLLGRHGQGRIEDF